MITPSCNCDATLLSKAQQAGSIQLQVISTNLTVSASANLRDQKLVSLYLRVEPSAQHLYNRAEVLGYARGELILRLFHGNAQASQTHRSVAVNKIRNCGWQVRFSDLTHFGHRATGNHAHAAEPTECEITQLDDLSSKLHVVMPQWFMQSREPAAADATLPSPAEINRAVRIIAAAGGRVLWR